MTARVGTSPLGLKFVDRSSWSKVVTGAARSKFLCNPSPDHQQRNHQFGETTGSSAKHLPGIFAVGGCLQADLDPKGRPLGLWQNRCDASALMRSSSMTFFSSLNNPSERRKQNPKQNHPMKDW